MTAFFDVDALGLRARIELPPGLTEDQRSSVGDAWAGALSAGNGEPDLRIRLRDGDWELAMERLTVDVTLAALDALRGKALMFHAAGVADVAGRVAAFVGPSGQGKTTLSRRVGEHYAYVSDETVAVTPELAVRPYRKPLSMVREGVPKQQVSPAAARLRDLPEAALRLAALVLIDRDPSAETVELRPVPLSEAVPELVPQMSYLRDQRKPLQSIAALCDAVGGVQRLTYSEAETVLPLLDEILDTTAASSSWSAAQIAATDGPFHAESVLDAIVTEGRVVVMADAMVHVLDGIAPTIWLTAVAGGDLADIVRAVEGEFGAPPSGDARVLVSNALDELLAAGVLRSRAVG